MSKVLIFFKKSSYFCGCVDLTFVQCTHISVYSYFLRRCYNAQLHVTYTEIKDAANLESMDAGDLEKSFSFYLCAKVA